MSKTIPFDSIVILDNRQRREFDAQAMEELRQSIEDRGLMHAPVMREFAGELILVAGERRLKAIQDLWALGGKLVYNNEIIPEGRVPYVTLGELSTLEAEEAELDENLRRKDLTWQEHAAAVQKLHNLRIKQSKAAIEADLATKSSDPATPPTTSNPIALTENGLRRELGLPDRPAYTL